MRYRILFLAWACVGVTACGADEEAVVRDSSGGVPVAVRVADIGCEECAPPAMLAPFSVTIGPDGVVYALDRFEPFVRRFGLPDKPLTPFGKKGQGPGELEQPGWIFPFDEVAAVYDNAQYFKLFDETGSIVAAPRIAPFRVPLSATYHEEGRIAYVMTFDPIEGGVQRRLDKWSLETGEHGVLLMDLSVLFETSSYPEGPAFLSPFAVAAALDGNIAVGDGWNYDIVIVGENGEELRRFGRAIARSRKSEARIDRERAEAARMASRAGVATPAMSEETAHFGRAALQFDDRERLWVRTERGADEDTVFDLFAADGEYLGEVSLPVRGSDSQFQMTAPFDVRGHYLVLLNADETGNTGVSVWRLEAPAQAR